MTELPDDIVLGLGRVVVALSSLDAALMKRADLLLGGRDRSLREIYLLPVGAKLNRLVIMEQKNMPMLGVYNELVGLHEQAEMLIRSGWLVENGSVFSVGYVMAEDGSFQPFKVPVEADTLRQFASHISSICRMLGGGPTTGGARN